MPREHKKYGKKRKRDDDDKPSRNEAPREEDRFQHHPSRRPEHAGLIDPEEGQFYEVTHGQHVDEYGRDAPEGEPLGGHDEFYGLLSDDDQAYFKRIEAMLELDQFETPEDKDLLLDSVWREADGKELKLACSQSCSRVLERLLKVSRPTHLKKLFRSFSSHFLFLVQHRFASHCCETLFLSAAPAVTQELISPMEPNEEDDVNDVYVSMENLFLYTVNELSEHLGFLMTDRFASHPLRVLIVALSGKPLADTAIVSTPPKGKEASSQWRSVPESFHEAVQNIASVTVGGLETHYLRTLTTNSNASQIIQRLLELEFIESSKSKAKDSLFRRLIPEDSPTEDTETGAFIKGLLYDSAGSRLLEVIVQCAPGKPFKGLYRGFFEGQIASMAKNDTASFVLVRILERLNADDLSQAITGLSPEMPTLLSRRRHAIIRALIERSRVRELDTQPIVTALEEFYGPPSADVLPRLLQLQSDDTPSLDIDETNPSATRHHARLLAETMLSHPTHDPARAFIISSLLLTPDATLKDLAQDRHATHVVQTALKAPLSATTLRPLISNLLPNVVFLASDPVGSHVVDALWHATDGSLFYLKERVAERLAAHEADVRETLPGRAVWRNWRVELFGRRKVEWIAKAKGRRSGAEFGGEAQMTQEEQMRQKKRGEANAATNLAPSDGNAGGKSAIEMARERWAAKQKGKGQKKGQDARVVRVR